MNKSFIRITKQNGGDAIIKASTIQLIQAHPTAKGVNVISTTNKKYSMFTTKMSLTQLEELL